MATKDSVSEKTLHSRSSPVYIEEEGVVIGNLLRSLEEIVKDPSSDVLLDTCVFHTSTDYISTRDPEELDPSVLQKSYGFKTGLRNVLERHSTILLIPEVVDEVAKLYETEDRAFRVAIQKFCDPQGEVVLAKETHDILQKDHSINAILVNFAQRNKYRPIQREVQLSQLFLPLLKEFDEALKLKKPDIKRKDTDERIIASLYSRALLFNRPVVVLSRDRDLFHLVRGSHAFLTHPEIKHPFAESIREASIVEAQYSSSGIYHRTRIHSALSRRYLEEDLELPSNISQLIARVNQLYESLSNQFDFLYEDSKHKKTLRQDDEEPHHTKKRTVTIGGKSTAIRDTPRYSPLRKNRLKSNTFSSAFMKKFGHLVDARHILEPAQQKSTSKMSPEIKDFIKKIAYKYIQCEEPEVLLADIEFSKKAANHFFASRERLFQLGLSQDKIIPSCKSFIEYGLYLRSIYGSKEIPVIFKRFVSLLDNKGNLDYQRVATELDPIREIFGVAPAVPVCLEQIASRFDLFTEFHLSTTFAKQRQHHDVLRTSGRHALEEAIVKYCIHDGNFDQYLRLALQHLVWGLDQGLLTIPYAKGGNHDS